MRASLVEDVRRLKIQQIREHATVDEWEKEYRAKHKK